MAEKKEVFNLLYFFLLRMLKKHGARIQFVKSTEQIKCLGLSAQIIFG